MVYLITGKKGAGKSHYAKAFKEDLEREGLNVWWIDGDEFREKTGNQDYSFNGRVRNLRDAAMEAAYFESQGRTVIMSFVMPQKILRDMIRKIVFTSIVIYVPGGTLWEGTIYERPSIQEMQMKYNYND